MQAKNQLTKAVKERYMMASKKEKGKILDEYCASTGYNPVICYLQDKAFYSASTG